ncbi:hypothetical protein [Pedobacter panaciterrae]
MKYIILSLALCVVFQATTHAQSQSLNPTFENMAPPSPNAAALGKFGSSPVGLSTGVPSVKVPIFTWHGKNFAKSVDVSLDYHAGGVQVDEMASNVGLGWALNTGGVISRTMRGIYDEYPIDGFLYKSLPIEEYGGNGPTNYSLQERVFNRMYSGKSDSQNDLFSFNFNGRTGRFVLGKNNDILLLDRSKLKIEKFISNPTSFSARITKFIITDELGYKYEFSDYEVTTTSVAGLPPPHASSWYLSKITNPAGTDSIIYEYEDFLLSATQTGRSQTVAYPVILDGVSQPANLSGSSAQTVNGKRIKKITFLDGITVSFLYKQAVRSDLTVNSTDKALEKIVISNGTQTYGYLLMQDYSLGGRLTLLSVQQYGSTEQETLKPYQFAYSSEPLPARFSSKKDHWGYPNGNSSQDLIPTEYVLVGGTTGPYAPYREFLGGNRDTDPAVVKAGSLKKITYPTGGYTEFEMEANKAVDIWLNKAVTIETPNPYTEVSDNFSFNSTGTGDINSPFIYTGVSNANVQFTITTNPISGGCSSCSLKLEIYKQGTSQLVSTQIMSLNSSNTNQISKNFTLANLINGDSFYAKTYLTGFDYANNGHYYGYGELKRRQQNPSGTVITKTFGTNQLYVGGLRAKKITDYTEAGTVASTREYEYLLEDGITSSGSLGYRPIYSYPIAYDVYPMGGVETGEDGYVFYRRADYIIRSSNSVNELPMVSGNPVTYKRVTEKIGQNGVYLGKTVRTFSTFADNPPYISQDFPTIPVQYASWNYGQLKTEEIYNSDNVLLKKTDNEYFNFQDGYSVDQSRVENFRSISFAPVSFVWDSHENPKIEPSHYPAYFLMKNFTPVAGKAEISQTTVTDYIAGQPATKIVTNYDYDQNNFYLKESRITNSKNVVLKTTYLHPPDMVAANEDALIYSGMVGLNIIEPIIKEIQFNSTTQIMLKNTKYKNWSGSLYAPESVGTKTLANAEEVRLKFLNYDTHGAPVSLQKANGPITTYIWGYGGEKLVAAIENSPIYTAVTSSLGNVETFRNNKNPTTTIIDSFLAPLKTSLPDAHIAIYKYYPLSGLLSTTDPKGMTTYYEYDNFQRLMNIKDQDLNIIKNFDYHYKP